MKGVLRSPISLAMAIVFMIGIVLNLAVAPHQAQAQETYRWKLQTVDPPSFVGPSKLLPRFVERIESASDGQLQIQVFTAGQLVPTLEIVNGLDSGTIQIAYTNSLYYSGQVPEGNLNPSSLPPLIFDSVDVAQEIYWNQGVDDILREAFADQGVHYLTTLFLGGVGAFWSKEKLDGLEDVEGFKIRSFGYAAKVWEELGASPTFLPHEEVYTSLAQGVIDGSQTDASYYERAKYYEVAPYFYTKPLFNVQAMSMMVSKEAWDELPDHLKEIVRNAARLYSQEYRMATYLEYQQMLTKLDDLGATQVAWPEEDMQQIKNVSKEFMDDIASKTPQNKEAVKIITDYLQELGRY